MASDDPEGGAGPSASAPTDLWGVGPRTADVLEAAPFSAADIADGAVSYRMLTEAGVNPGVAARLRRRYSLVWSFDWTVGADLVRRAEQLRNLTEGEREWIIESFPEDAAGPGDDDGRCRRCGAELVTYSLLDREAVACDDCGYVGVPIAERHPATGAAESLEAAVRRFLEGRSPPPGRRKD